MTGESMVWLGDAQTGWVVPEAEALISVFDHGVTVGDGVFETIKVADGQPFALTRHIARLQRSCKAMGLACPNPEHLRFAVQETLRANAAQLAAMARMRITVTAGPGPLGSDRSDAEVTVMIAVMTQKPWAPTASVVTVPWTRNASGALAGVKSTSYAENVLALRYAHAHDADEGMFLNTTGAVCEGSSTNLFIVRDSTILTPPLSDGCLAGVTRELVMEWCGATEASFGEAEALDADEVFVTSSTRDIHPVARWGERAWQAPGPMTTRAQIIFAEHAARNTDP